jgi:hypothetical protein
MGMLGATSQRGANTQIDGEVIVGLEGALQRYGVPSASALVDGAVATLETSGEPLTYSRYPELVRLLSRYVADERDREVFYQRAKNLLATLYIRQLAQERSGLTSVIEALDSTLTNCVNALATCASAEHVEQLESVRTDLEEALGDDDPLVTSLESAIKSQTQKASPGDSLRKRLLPSSRDVSMHHHQFACFHRPGTGGGDWWCTRDLGGGRLLVVVARGEVVGIDAGVVAAVLDASIRAACSKACDAQQVMDAVLAGARSISAKVDVVVSILDSSQRTHDCAATQPEFMWAVRERLPRSTGTSTLRSGDILVWTSPGVFEEEDRFGMTYSEASWMDALAALPNGCDGAKTRYELASRLLLFRGGKESHSDVTIIAVRIP